MAHEMRSSHAINRPAMRRARWLLVLMGLLLLATPEARAYVGPGAGITAIGSLLALLAGLLFAIIGFVWYPIKRLRRRRKESQQQEARKS